MTSIALYTVLEYTLSYIYPFSYTERHYFTNSFLISIAVLPGYMLGKWVTPDLDIFGITQNEWDAVRKGKIFGLFFVMYWMPYGYLFKGKHRSFWTHSYFFSTFIRLIYIFWWILLLGEISGMFWFLLFGIFLGMAISDGIHIFADNNHKGKKKRWTFWIMRLLQKKK